VGWIGVIATAAPMLGLLGTVIGMIGSFQVLGHSRNAARPDELAVGISTALVTTCEGLVLAVPLIFAHAFMKDKVTGVAQEMGHLGERVLTLIAASQPGGRTVSAAPGMGPIPGSRPVAQGSPGPVTAVGTSGYGAVRS
jgi:biopolymer transport protein ExbB